jgi:tetratricopeptide (TPR) repeat protein
MGVALDEQKKWKAALPWFEKAAKAEPKNGMYLSNIAELYEKLGNIERAIAYAKRSRACGHKSDVVERLLQDVGEIAAE